MASLGSLIEQAGSDFNFEGMEYRDFRDNAQAGGHNEDEERPPSSYADAAANGGNRGHGHPGCHRDGNLHDPDGAASPSNL